MKSSFTAIALVALAAALAGCQSAPPADLTTPRIVAFNQKIANDSILVQEVVSPGPGWVVLYTKKDDELGSIVGHTTVQPGVNRWIRIPIDNTGIAYARAATYLYVALHVDADVARVHQFPGPDSRIMEKGPAATASVQTRYPKNIFFERSLRGQ